MGWLVNFFFGKSTETLKAMREDRLRRIKELEEEVVEIDRQIAKQGD